LRPAAATAEGARRLSRGGRFFTAVRRRQSGQTSLFVLCSFLTLFLFFSLVANVGQAVNRRVMLQMVADAGAFTGAASQARSMNAIAYYNQLIYDTWYITEIAMLFFTVHICGVDDVITTVYKILRTAFSLGVTISNHAGSILAIMDAEKVTRQNAAQLFPDGSLETPLSGGLGSFFGNAQHIINVQKAWPALFNKGVLVELEENVDLQKNWICVYWIGLRNKNDRFDRWFRKDEDKKDQVTRFYWWVKAKSVKPMVLAGIFPNVPEMTAVALAKPIGGHINHGDFSGFSGGDGPKYVAKMIPVSTISPLGLSGVTH
jgi:hypothetical protein